MTTTQTPLTDYAQARRAVARLGIDIRAVKDELEQFEAEVTRAVLADKALTNDAQRKAAIANALHSHGTVKFLRGKLRDLEGERDQAEAEADIAARYLQAEHWALRQRYVEALEGRGETADEAFVTF